MIWFSFVSVSWKKMPNFAPRSRRNTCCKHGPCAFAGVPPRARFEVWCIFFFFGTRHFKRESNDDTSSLRQQAQCHALLKIKYQWLNDTSNSHFPGSNSVALLTRGWKRLATGTLELYAFLQVYFFLGWRRPSNHWTERVASARLTT